MIFFFYAGSVVFPVHLLATGAKLDGNNLLAGKRVRRGVLCVKGGNERTLFCAGIFL